MIKSCPRCGKSFECVHSANCWCATITLDDATRTKLKQYNDCLCKECLIQIKKEVIEGN